MLRNARELWAALIAALLITALYGGVVILTRRIPPARELFGLSLGILGFVLMLMTEILYSLRKRSRLARWGRMSDWLSFHIFTGLVGPYMVLLHSSWKFNGLAGVITLFTVVIVVSGFVGRYIYTRIPRTADGAEMESGLSQEALKRARRLMAWWHSIHIPIGVVLFAAAFIHMSGAIYYALLFKVAGETMQKNRLGCLTGTGLIAAAVTLVAIAGLGLLGGGALFSPGALSAKQTGAVLGSVHSHADTRGNCAACHTAPWDAAVMADRCTACHTDIAVQMRQVATLHGQLAGKGAAAPACYDCHPDHRGASAALVDMSSQQFPHEGLGFSLKGHSANANGAAFTCQDCHATDIKTFDQKTCGSCHAQIDAAFVQRHLAAYGPNCLGCHDGVDRFSKGFSHAAFAFTLSGKHANVACDQCHNHALALADFAAAPKECIACHKQNDPHAGQFGQDCSACHSSEGWTPAKFDHNLSAFKLTGAHANVGCTQCHVNNVFKGTPADCYACHKQRDAHNGQFGTDCSACHTTTRWNDVTFAHNKSNFPLTGAHAGVACTQCHTNGQFKGLGTACVTCHQDPAFHLGVLGTDCASCHGTTAWSPAQFNHSHPSSGEGSGVGHGGASCRTCHPDTVFTFTCLACHSSNHPSGN